MLSSKAANYAVCRQIRQIWKINYKFVFLMLAKQC